MINFQDTPKPRSYLSRREQWRLLVLVMAMGLVVFLMNEARKPENWAWLFAVGEVSPRPAKAAEQPGGRYFPGVKPEYFLAIRDDMPFRPDEQDAWFNLFDVLNKTNEATLEEKSIGRVTFAQLFQQSDEYRGELVTIQGTVRRAHRLTAPKNDCGIKKYYQIWVQPADSPNSPIVVYCLHLPKGFPTGMDISAEAEITGFFFKRWAYKARGTLCTAPTLAARTVRWQKVPEVVKSAPMNVGTLLLLFGVAVAVSALVVVHVIRRTRPARRYRQ